MGKVNINVALNETLSQFLLATDGRADDMRMSNRHGIRADDKDVGKLSRLFKRPSGARHIQENNEIRTQLLNALSEQYGGRQKIPDAVKKALYGSSVFGKSDMSDDAGLVVISGRPLTVRRVKAVLGAVMSDLAQTSLDEMGEVRVESQNIGQPKVEVKKDVGQPKGEVKEPPKGKAQNIEQPKGEVKEPPKGKTQKVPGIKPPVVTNVPKQNGTNAVKQPRFKSYDDVKNTRITVGNEEDTFEGFLAEREYPPQLRKAHEQCFLECMNACKGDAKAAYGMYYAKDTAGIDPLPEEKEQPKSGQLADMPEGWSVKSSDDAENALRGKINQFANTLSQEARKEISDYMKVHPDRGSLSEKWMMAYCHHVLDGIVKQDGTLAMCVDSTGIDLGDGKEKFLNMLRGDLGSNVTLVMDLVKNLKGALEALQGQGDSNVIHQLLDNAVTGGIKEIAEAFKLGLEKPHVNAKVEPNFVQYGKNEFSAGAVYRQTSLGNMCPIISTINALMLSGEDFAKLVSSALTPKTDTTGMYYEFPYRVGGKNLQDGQKLRVYENEVNECFKGQTTNFLDIEKVMFAALRKANILSDKYKPGGTFDVNSALLLFDMAAEQKGQNGHSPLSKGELCVIGKKASEALAKGNPCILGIPGHFMAIKSVTYDENGLPTFHVVESSTATNAAQIEEYKPDALTRDNVQFYFGTSNHILALTEKKKEEVSGDKSSGKVDVAKQKIAQENKSESQNQLNGKGNGPKVNQKGSQEVALRYADPKWVKKHMSGDWFVKFDGNTAKIYNKHLKVSLKANFDLVSLSPLVEKLLLVGTKGKGRPKAGNNFIVSELSTEKMVKKRALPPGDLKTMNKQEVQIGKPKENIERNNQLDVIREVEDPVIENQNEKKIIENKESMVKSGKESKLEKTVEEETITELTGKMAKDDSDDVEALVKADSSNRSYAVKWVDAYIKYTAKSLTSITDENAAFWKEVAQNSRVPDISKRIVAFKQELSNGCSYVLNRLRRGLDEYIRNGFGHDEVQEFAKDIIKGIFSDYVTYLQIERDHGERTKKDPQAIVPKGIEGTKKLSEFALIQGQNTSPIISLMNAMLMTSEKMKAKAVSLLTYKIDESNSKRSYFEFPHKGKPIKVYTDEVERMFKGNKAPLTDFEKAVFVGIERAGLATTFDGKAIQPGEFFEISPVFALFGFKELNSGAFVGNVNGAPSKFQKFMEGNDVMNALRWGKPCVMGLPGHFVGIQEVTFDPEGQPTYWYFDSTTGKMQSLAPEENKGVQFYIGNQLTN